jgi:hypothetical protein
MCKRQIICANRSIVDALPASDGQWALFSPIMTKPISVEYQTKHSGKPRFREHKCGQ